jgi:two-component system, OmpR family, phosphate regulon sensor histidine kinase PhoR
VKLRMLVLVTLGAVAVATLLAALVTSNWVIWLVVAALAVAVAGHLLSTPLRTRVAHLTRATQKLREGDLTYRVGTGRTDELGDLARAFNDMAAELERRIAHLSVEHEQMAGVLGVMDDGVLVLDDLGKVVVANPAATRILGPTRDELLGRPIVHVARNFPVLDFLDRVSREHRACREEVELPGGRHISVQAIPLEHTPASVPQVLMHLRDETSRRRVDQLRRDFVANVSHELKTPLAGLHLLASTLGHAIDEDPEQARRFVERLGVQVDHLSGLVDDLLALSELEYPQRGPQPDFAEVDLAEIAREVATAAQPGAIEKGKTVSVVGTEPVPILGQRARLTGMARNLVDNAISYTDSGGHITITTGVLAPQADHPRVEPSLAYLTVRDDGIGIPRMEQPRVFERFYRVDKARSRETGGTGLGLSIVRHVAEQHGGDVGVESTVGVGSTFTVWLPLASDARATLLAQQRARDDDACTEESE